MKRFILWILEVLFPPKHPRIPEYHERFRRGQEQEMLGDGIVTPARPKQYRDGIERYFATISASIVLGLLALTWQVSVAPGPKPQAISGTPLIERNLEYQIAKQQAARVLVANGCSDTYADAVSRAAVDHGMSPRIMAGLAFVESSCNPNAVSNKGAVGLLQINIAVWHVSRKQALDPEFNLDKGTAILAEYVRERGIQEGLHSYNGLGDSSNQYAHKVLVAANRR
jgi:Transglycosylase SLT domain